MKDYLGNEWPEEHYRHESSPLEAEVAEDSLRWAEAHLRK